MAARFIESGVEAPLQLMAQLYTTFTKYRLGALNAGDLMLLGPSMALSLVSLAKANSDMYDRKTITERTAVDRPPDWAPKKNEAAIVKSKTTLIPYTKHGCELNTDGTYTKYYTDGTTIELVEGDSLFLRKDADARQVHVKLDWYTRLMRGQRAEHAEGEVELAALAPPKSFGGYVLWTLASMLYHIAEVVLRILVGVMMFAYVLTGWSAIYAGAALIGLRLGLYQLALRCWRVPRERLPNKLLARIASVFADSVWSPDPFTHNMAGALTAAEAMVGLRLIFDALSTGASTER